MESKHVRALWHAYHDDTFNRTSMESKLGGDESGGYRFWTFNRTSMESKQLSREPITRTRGSPFNRTSMESKRTSPAVIKSAISLLIEPVWNRNIKFRLCLSAILPAFNRTSMESKLPKRQADSQQASDF